MTPPDPKAPLPDCAHTKTPYSQGVTLVTRQTIRWSKEQIKNNDIHEQRLVFSSFSSLDEGKGRILVAKCEKAEDAAFIVMACNAYESSQQKIAAQAEKIANLEAAVDVGKQSCRDLAACIERRDDAVTALEAREKRLREEVKQLKSEAALTAIKYAAYRYGTEQVLNGGKCAMCGMHHGNNMQCPTLQPTCTLTQPAEPAKVCETCGKPFTVPISKSEDEACNCWTIEGTGRGK